MKGRQPQYLVDTIKFDSAIQGRELYLSKSKDKSHETMREEKKSKILDYENKWQPKNIEQIESWNCGKLWD